MDVPFEFKKFVLSAKTIELAEGVQQSGALDIQLGNQVNQVLQFVAAAITAAQF